jgi:AcrR family transcriptional regulator
LTGLAEMKQQEREARRRLIRSAAQRLFAEKDFRDVTVREIAKVAGVAVGTIYNYYANLDELFVDVFVKGAGEIAALLDRTNGAGRLCSLTRLCETYVGYLSDNMSFYQMMAHFMLGGKLSDDATEKVNLVMRALLDRFQTIIEASGGHRETRLAAQALFSALNGIMISYAGYPGRSLDDIRRHTEKLSRLTAEVFAQKAANSGSSYCGESDSAGATENAEIRK